MSRSPALTREGAHRVARDCLVALGWGAMRVLPEDTLRHSSGWSVFFSTAEYAATRDPALMAAGAGPILVTDDGRAFATGSGRDPSTYPEDVAVMAGHTRNPLRILRYLWRRATGSTPFEVRLPASESTAEP